MWTEESGRLGNGVGEFAVRKVAGRQCARQLCEAGILPCAGMACFHKHANSVFAASRLVLSNSCFTVTWVCALQSYASEHACKEYHTRSKRSCLNLQLPSARALLYIWQVLQKLSSRCISGY